MIPLGPCCVCERRGGVRNVLQLEFKSPSPGKGWGCLQCGLPADGAIAVVCDQCLGRMASTPNGDDRRLALKFVCAGFPGIDGRVPFETVKNGPKHTHDLAKHAGEFEEFGAPRAPQDVT